MTGIVTDKHGDVKWIVQGTWDDYIEYAKVTHEKGKSSISGGCSGGSNNGAKPPVIETTAPKRIWKNNPLV